MAHAGLDRGSRSRMPYSALVRTVGRQARELYPGAGWSEVSSELEVLWNSCITGCAWTQVEGQIERAWKEAGSVVHLH